MHSPVSAREKKPRIEPSWLRVLQPAFDDPAMDELRTFLQQRRDAGARIFPAWSNVFRAFELTPFDEVRVVIVGQDPYHGEGQAHGLCFSVPHGVTPPPSLVNVFREIENDLGLPRPLHGNLEAWARQGVLLLNATLTVEARQAGSHQGRGWERFTDAVIDTLAREKEGLIFLLWGRHAAAKGRRIDTSRHHVLTAAHPSPLSAHNGFFGCAHFSKVNEILQAAGQEPIDWSLPAP